MLNWLERSSACREPAGSPAVIALGALVAGAGAAAQEPRAITRPVGEIAGRVERVDRSSRSLTLRRADGLSETVYVGPEITVFSDLKAGDSVRVRVTESIIVSLQPRAKPLAPTDTTAAAKSASPNRDILQQLTAVVTLESIDIPMHSVVYKGADNLRTMRQVQQPELLKGLKPGDVVEITYSRERAISIDRQP